MYGIHIDYIESFNFLFRPIFEYLTDCYWLICFDSLDLSELYGPYDEKSGEYTPDEKLKRFEESLEYVPDDNPQMLYLNSSLIPEYASYIREDWNKMFAFKKPLRLPSEWYEKYAATFNSGKESAKFIEQTVDFCFLNWDGAYWEFYTRDKKPFDIILLYLKSIEDFQEGIDFKKICIGESTLIF